MNTPATPIDADAAPHGQRPNLLFVFADQMRGMDMRCAGNPDIHTPNLDRLAREGVLATRHYATTPLCGPNRATMLTGVYPTTHGVMPNDRAVRTDLPTMGTVPRDHGYRTGYIGKWHLDGPPRDKFTPPGPRRLGFDDFWAVYNCHHEYFNTRYYRDTPELIRAEGYEPEIQTDLAIEFLEGQAGDDRPFCLALSWGPPHNPYEQVPEKYRQMYDPDQLTLRPNCADIPREHLDPNWSHRRSTADYYAAITALDDQLGRLLDQLDQMGAADNTIVVFTSDHGDMMWSHGVLYKQLPYEESVHVPLVMRWPGGLPAGRVCDTLIGSVDLLPTFVGLMGLTDPGTFEGLDLAAALRGDADAPAPDAVLLTKYGTYTFRPDQPCPPWRGIRTARYTYAATLDHKPWLVFDNETDPYQMRNLADDPGQAAVIEPLKRELAAWLERIGDRALPCDAMMTHFRAEHPEAVDAAT